MQTALRYNSIDECTWPYLGGRSSVRTCATLKSGACWNLECPATRLAARLPPKNINLMRILPRMRADTNRARMRIRARHTPDRIATYHTDRPSHTPSPHKRLDGRQAPGVSAQDNHHPSPNLFRLIVSIRASLGARTMEHSKGGVLSPY